MVTTQPFTTTGFHVDELSPIEQAKAVKVIWLAALVIAVKLSGHVFRVFIRNVGRFSFVADGNSIRARFVTPGCSRPVDF